MDGLAHQPAVHTVDWVHQHAVAGFPVVDVLAGLHDLAGHVQADDHGKGQLDAGHATAREYVVVVQR